MTAQLVINPGKQECIGVEGVQYSRNCIKTHVITEQDNIEQVVRRYALPHLQQGDILFITEKAVACTQKRAIPLEDIRPRPLARLLSRFVCKSPYGIGLSMPETMEMALRECGTVRILFAALCGAVGKLFGKRGVFYNIAGEKARSIDGPCACTIPPYNRCVVLGPADPYGVAREISQAIHVPVLITDINDLGGNILGYYPLSLNPALYTDILKDNPLGQGAQQTPMGIVRKI